MNKNVKVMQQEVKENGMVELEDEDDAKVWFSVYTKCVSASLSSGQTGKWSRGCATNCANYAILAMKDGLDE